MGFKMGRKSNFHTCWENRFKPRVSSPTGNKKPPIDGSMTLSERLYGMPNLGVGKHTNEVEPYSFRLFLQVKFLSRALSGGHQSNFQGYLGE